MVATSVHHAHADLSSQRRFDGVVAFVSVVVTCSRENPMVIIGKFWKNVSPETKKMRTARGLRHPPQSRDWLQVSGAPVDLFVCQV
jgi:hypothetical protein